MAKPKDEVAAKAIGERMRQAREAAGYTSAAAGKELRISRQSLEAYENGKKDPPPMATMWRIARLYRKAPSWFLEDKTPDEEPERFDPLAVSILREMDPDLQRAIVADWWPRIEELYHDMKQMESYLEAVTGKAE